MNESNAKILMSFKTKIAGIRIIDQSLIPTFWDINVEFFSVLDDKDSSDESNVAYNVLYFWANELMDDLLVFDPNDEFAREIAMQTTNPVITTPGIPSDDILVQVLHCKMNAISGECLGILKLSIKSDDSDLEYQYVDFHGGDVLPGMDYIGDVLTAHSKPWWHRDTAECHDLPLKDNITELNSSPAKKDILERYRTVLRSKFKHGLYSDVDPFSFDADVGPRENGKVEVDFDPDFIVDFPEVENDSNIIEIPKD